MRPLIVGEAPTLDCELRPGVGLRLPLTGRSGRRIARLAGVGAVRDFADATNLYAIVLRRGEWSTLPAHHRAMTILSAELPSRSRVVLLGRRVARAFEVEPSRPFFRWTTHVFLARAYELAVVPHPSGLSRWWNDPANVRRARRFWRGLVS